MSQIDAQGAVGGDVRATLAAEHSPMDHQDRRSYLDLVLLGHGGAQDDQRLSGLIFERQDGFSRRLPWLRTSLFGAG